MHHYILTPSLSNASYLIVHCKNISDPEIKCAVQQGRHTWHRLWCTYQTRYSCWELMMIYIPQMTSVHDYHFSWGYTSMYALSAFIEFIKGKTVVDMFYVYFTFPSFTLAWGCDPEHTMICQPIKSCQWTTEQWNMWPSDPGPLQSAGGCKHDMLPGLCLAGDCWRAGAEKVGSRTAQLSSATGVQILVTSPDQPQPAPRRDCYITNILSPHEG